ncbi:MAG: hypothetical protein ACYCVZ_00755 [Streptosporangiaceae bacterium]
MLVERIECGFDPENMKNVIHADTDHGQQAIVPEDQVGLLAVEPLRRLGPDVVSWKLLSSLAVPVSED